MSTICAMAERGSVDALLAIPNSSFTRPESYLLTFSLYQLWKFQPRKSNESKQARRGEHEDVGMQVEARQADRCGSTETENRSRSACASMIQRIRTAAMDGYVRDRKDMENGGEGLRVECRRMSCHLRSGPATTQNRRRSDSQKLPLRQGNNMHYAEGLLCDGLSLILYICPPYIRHTY